MRCPCGGAIRTRSDRGYTSVGCERCHSCLTVESLLDEIDDRGNLNAHITLALKEVRADVARLREALAECMRLEPTSWRLREIVAAATEPKP